MRPVRPDPRSLLRLKTNIRWHSSCISTNHEYTFPNLLSDCWPTNLLFSLLSDATTTVQQMAQNLFQWENVAPPLHHLLVMIYPSKNVTHWQVVSMPSFKIIIILQWTHRFPSLVLGPDSSVNLRQYVCTCPAHKGPHHLWFNNWANWNCLAREYRTSEWLAQEGNSCFWQYQECLPGEQYILTILLILIEPCLLAFHWLGPFRCQEILWDWFQ